MFQEEIYTEEDAHCRRGREGARMKEGREEGSYGCREVWVKPI